MVASVRVAAPSPVLPAIIIVGLLIFSEAVTLKVITSPTFARVGSPLLEVIVTALRVGTISS